GPLGRLPSLSVRRRLLPPASGAIPRARRGAVAAGPSRASPAPVADVEGASERRSAPRPTAARPSADGRPPPRGPRSVEVRLAQRDGAPDPVPDAVEESPHGRSRTVTEGPAHAGVGPGAGAGGARRPPRPPRPRPPAAPGPPR